MNKNFLKINLSLSFLIIQTQPNIRIKVDDQVFFEGSANSDRLDLTIETSVKVGSHSLTIDFLNKNYDELQNGKDMAVIVDSIKFQHLPDEFKYYSSYCPDYPEDWLKNNPKAEPVIHSNYLGWNGHWKLNFETPIYPWIHQHLNLGWAL